MLLPVFFFFFNDTATTEIYTVSDTLSLHDALPIPLLLADHRGSGRRPGHPAAAARVRARSEEHTSELQSPDTIAYAVFCIKKKNKVRQPRRSNMDHIEITKT